MRLRAKILLAFLLAGLPLVAVNVWWIVRNQRVERERTLERLRGEAEGAAGIAQVFLGDLAARGEITARYILEGGELQPYLSERLTDLRRRTAGIAGLAWLDADGRIVAGHPADLFRPGASVADRAGFQALRGGQAWVLDDLLIEEAQGRPLPLLRMLVRDVNGAIRGAVAIALRPEVFGSLLPGRTRWAEIRLADRAGRLVYATDLAEPSPSERQGWADVPGVRAALRGRAATDLEVRLAGAREETGWMSAHVPLLRLGWVASALVPTATAMRASREALYKEVGAQALLVALCVAAALILAHRVATPARRLADAARRIAGGDREARAGLTGRDELAAVGRAFDEMAETLESSWRAVTAQRDVAENMAGRLATLGQLAGVVGSTLDTRRVFDFVVEATSRLLGGAAALLLVADEAGESLTIRASYGVGSPHLRTQDRFRAGDGLAGWVFQWHEPLVLPDMVGDPRTLNRAWVEAEGLCAFAGVPLMVRDRCLGVLCAMYSGRQAFGQADVDLLAAFAAHAAAAVQNARLYERATAEGERLRAFLEAMPEAVLIGEGEPGGKDIHLVMANRARAELLRTTALVSGARTPYYEYTRPDGTPLDDADLPLQRAIWRGEATRGMELVARFPDGSQRHILANALPLPETAGRRQAVSVYQDITERKQAEEALRESEARYRVLVHIAGLISSTLDPGRVFNSVAEATSRLLEGAAALVFLTDETGGSVAICASHGVGHPELRTQNRFRAGEGLPGIVLQTKKPVILGNILEDPRALNRAWLEAEGLRAFVGVPLLFRERCLGVLFAARGGNRPFGQRDLDLLAAFAAHVATAIQNAHLFERATMEGERLRAMVEAMPEAVVVGEVGPGESEVRLVMANRAHAELLRIPALVGGARTAYYEFLRPDGTPMENAELALERAIWRSEATQGMELAVRFPDGSERYILENAAPLPETAGTRRAVAVFQDITERKRLEQQTELEVARLKAIMDTIPEAVLILDAASGRVVQANRAALEIRGGAQLIGVRPFDLGFRVFTDEGDRELPPDEWPSQRACRGEHILGQQVILEVTGGRRTHYLVSAAPVQDPQGGIRQAVLIGADISALKRAEEELKRLAAEEATLYGRAAREAQVKGLLLEELNHRVRNNLALILSFMELQRETPEGRQAAAVLEDAISRVEGLALVHNALAGMGFEAAEYGPLVRGLAEQTLVQGPLAGRVAFEVEGVPLRLPSAQLTALGLITNELFTNIAKHAFPGGRRGNVHVTAEAAGGVATIRVRDDGVGLPAGFAEQPGHLGLQLIRSLAEVSLKGTFALESRGGTTAVIRFPLPDTSPRDA